MFNPAPTTFIASWSEDGTNVSFPIASVPELTAAEADAVTGDLRKIALALCDNAFEKYNALATGDKPNRMVMRKNTSTNDATGVTTRTYTFEFQLASSPPEVAAE